MVRTLSFREGNLPFKWPSFVQMFRFHVFGVFMEVIYEMMEGRNFYHQAEAKRLSDHPNTNSGRHQPTPLKF